MKEWQTLIAALGLGLVVMATTNSLSEDLGAIKNELINIGDRIKNVETRFNDHIVDHNK